MTRPMKLTTLGLVSALTFAVVIMMATPLTAHAGSMSIYNKNCTQVENFVKKKQVTVHVYSSLGYTGCTNEWVVVHRGHTETIELVPDSGYGQRCGHYMHEAKGTVGGKYDVHGDETASITCKRDWAWVCQCTKD